MNERKSAFAAVADQRTSLLILGSLPGDASLAVRQYYAHPRNQFWDLVGAVIDRPDLPQLPYPDRLSSLARHGIGVWDVIASAHRPGSLDTAIRQAEPAPLVDLVGSLPNLKAVAFNGAKSAGLGRRILAGSRLALVDLPSSSPAHATLSLAEKRDRWLELKEFLV